MDIKERIADYIKQLLKEYKFTQKELAELLGVGAGSLTAYIKGREVPGIKVLIELARLGDLTLDNLVGTNTPPAKKELIIGGKGNITAINGKVHIGRLAQKGDTYNINTTLHKTYPYTYQPGDLTEEQAARIKGLVDEIIDLEKVVSKNPKSYATVYNVLKRRYKVVYYRKIGEDRFLAAETYLKMWKGRLLKSQKLPLVDNEFKRKSRYKAIFAAAKNQLGFTKKQVDSYILAEYDKFSIKDLDNDALDNLYARFMEAKRKR